MDDGPHHEQSPESCVWPGTHTYPITISPNIRNADALETDWPDLLSPETCDYVFGNPPFVGAKFQTEDQCTQVREIAALGGKGGTLDYVSAWFIRAGEYAQRGQIRIGFVATNSIIQGEQVSQLWPILFCHNKLEITFAHRTFAWGSDALGMAHVHVVIIGLDSRETTPGNKRLFSYPDINGEPEETRHAALSPYLFDAAGFADHRPRRLVCVRRERQSKIAARATARRLRLGPARGLHGRRWRPRAHRDAHDPRVGGFRRLPGMAGLPRGARGRAPSKRDDDQEDRAAAATADGVPANELAPATSEPGDLDPADAREEEHRGGDGKAQLQSPGRARAGQFPNRSPRLTGAGKSACVPAPQTGIEPESPLPTLPEHPPSHSQDLYRHQCEPPEPGPNQPLATLEFP